MEVIYSISKQEGEFLLKLARESIEHFLKTGKILKVVESSIPYENLKKYGASFVTLETKQGNLRGCIGSIIPHRPLYEDVIYNAVSSAVYDPRFRPVSVQELDDIKIKISVLTYPEPLPYTDWRDLLEKIQPFKDGIIIKYKGNSATFLPEVWETLPDKQLFLSNLCLKAGLEPQCYKSLKLQVFRYRAMSFSE